MSVTVTQSFSQMTLYAPDLNKQYNESLVALTGILRKFKDWKDDDLSLDLYAWGAEVVAVNVEEALKNKELLLENTKKKIEILVKTILINPFDSSPLISPIILGKKWTWVQWMLDEYQSLLPSEFPPTSPFDGTPLEYQPHSFAIEILNWVKKLKTDADIGEPQNPEFKPVCQMLHVLSSSLPKFTLAPIPPRLENLPEFKPFRTFRLQFYLSNAQKIVQLHAEKNKTQEAYKDTNKLILRTEEILTEQREFAIELTAAFNAVNTRILTLFEDTKAANQVTLDIADARANALINELQGVNHSLQEEQKINRSNEARLKQLEEENRQVRQTMMNTPQAKKTICLLM